LVGFDEFSIALTTKTFGDVRPDRNRRPLNLVPEPEITTQSGVATAAIDMVRQLTRILPGLNILKPQNPPHNQPNQPNYLFM